MVLAARAGTGCGYLSVFQEIMRFGQCRRGWNSLAQMDAVSERTSRPGNRHTSILGNPVIADRCRFRRVDSRIRLNGVISHSGGIQGHFGIHVQAMGLMLLGRQVEDGVITKIVRFGLRRHFD